MEGRTVRPPLVSICIPAYARPIELREAITSVLSQGLDEIEVVVSDDSGDLEGVVRAIGDERISYFRNERPLGMAGNYMAALDRSRGELIGLIDDDDWLRPGFVSAVVSHFERNPSVGVVFTGKYVSRKGRLKRIRWPLSEGLYQDFLPVWLEHKPTAYPAALMRREVWQQCRALGPFPDLITADALLWIRPAELGWPFYCVDQPLLVYRSHPGGLSNHEQLMKDDSVSLWELLSFDDPHCGRLRDEQLGRALLSRAATHLKRGRTEEARADIARAVETAPRTARMRRWITSFLANHPALVPLTVRTWRGVRRLQGRRTFTSVDDPANGSGPSPDLQ